MVNNNTSTLPSTLTTRSAEEKVMKFYQRFHNENRMASKLAFYENKEPSLLPRSEYDKLSEIHQKLHDSNIKEDKIIAALELAARCQHWNVKKIDWRFVIPMSSRDLDLMEALTPDVKEYLENHNTARFVFCPMCDGEPRKKELVNLYLEDIDTYNEVVRFAREMFEFLP